MSKAKTENVQYEKNIEITHHKKIYFINKAKLSYTLDKIGISAKLNYTKEDLRTFLFKNRLMYTEFLEFISDKHICA